MKLVIVDKEELKTIHNSLIHVDNVYRLLKWDKPDVLPEIKAEVDKIRLLIKEIEKCLEELK